MPLAVRTPIAGASARGMALGEAFTPTRPRRGPHQLTGRRAELRRIVQAFQEEKGHVVLYSERGRGKTSLANLVANTLRQGGMIVAQQTCEADSTFETIMRGLARDLPSALLAASAEEGGRRDAAPGDGCEEAFPSREIRPRDVVALPSRLTCAGLVCIVDEFDRVEDARTRVKLADTIKQLSDGGVPLHFMIVGVSENLEQILGQHPSIQRNLVAVHLPLLTDAEICAVIEKGAAQTGFVFSMAALSRVAVLARGNPYMAQLLGLRLVQAAAAREDTTVSEQDFSTAMSRMLLEAPPQFVELYAALTSDGDNAEMAAALRRIATAEQDPWGRVHTRPAPDQGVLIGGKGGRQHHIAAAHWRIIEAAGLLRPIGPGSGLCAFTNRGLMHYVQVLAARTSECSEPPPRQPAVASDAAAIRADPMGRPGAAGRATDGSRPHLVSLTSPTPLLRPTEPPPPGTRRR